jgi:hypothetical protein
VGLRALFFLCVYGLNVSCQAFPLLMREVGATEEVKFWMAVAFPLVVLPWAMLLTRVTERIDRDLKRTSCHNRTEPCGQWVRHCMQLAFTRLLFVSVEEWSTVMVVQLISLLQDFVLYPLRCLAPVWRLTQRAKQLVTGGGGVVQSEVHLKAFQDERVLSFYFLCMAERISITTYPASLLVLHYNYNGAFFFMQGDDATAESQFTRLMVFCLIMLCIEWASSVICTVVLGLVTSRNALLDGGHLLASPHFKHAAVLFAVYVCFDTVLSTVQLDDIQFF